MAENKFENLSRFAVNLNERAAQGKLDPVIGRDEEIRRVLQILSRRTKNNPILVGEPGVGKTAIAEGIRKINEADPSKSYIAIKSLETMEKVADGQATKIIIPSEMQSLAGLAASCKEIFKG